MPGRVSKAEHSPQHCLLLFCDLALWSGCYSWFKKPARNTWRLLGRQGRVGLSSCFSPATPSAHSQPQYELMLTLPRPLRCLLGPPFTLDACIPFLFHKRAPVSPVPSTPGTSHHPSSELSCDLPTVAHASLLSPLSPIFRAAQNMRADSSPTASLYALGVSSPP